ncbi:putative RING-H2 finger protein ATL21A [Hevea brasiliensis]|uniref:putative RING-H2 finger protein ATL21A n=1 Tax=Hevea brasiliensis TaxID=3981 RepID=UPI0025D5DB3D|nr:putative RING-H2 finger protein ATL21A [Hevea brasiliensis]
MVACLFLLSILFLHHGVGLNDQCSTSSCGMQGPPVRFPFRFKGRQPLHCSYPAAGFDLSCSQNNHTVLELPNSWKLLVQAIDYNFQVINASYLDGFCLPRRLLFNSNLSDISPFFFTDELDYSYNLFNCPLKKEHYLLQPVSCLSDLRHHVYAIPSYASFQDLVPLLSCSKLHNISIVAEYSLYSLERFLHLKWHYPNCSYCEEEGKYCRLKSNTTGSETECYGIIKPTKGSAIKFIATGAVLGSIFLVVAAILFYRRHRFNRIEREYQSKIEKFLDDYKSFKPARYSYALLRSSTTPKEMERSSSMKWKQ